LLEIPIVKGNTKLSTGAFFQIKKGSAKWTKCMTKINVWYLNLTLENKLLRW
jgi:hypothetical protein